MHHHWHDMRQLSQLLEAEWLGRPFDRKMAHSLASSLAEKHPEMRNSMRLICERMASGPCGNRP